MLDLTTGSLVERCARAYGPRVAVVQDGRNITYDQMVAQVRQAGRALLGLGLRPGDRVALLMPDRPEVLYAY